MEEQKGDIESIKSELLGVIENMLDESMSIQMYTTDMKAYFRRIVSPEQIVDALIKSFPDVDPGVFTPFIGTLESPSFGISYRGVDVVRFRYIQAGSY